MAQTTLSSDPLARFRVVLVRYSKPTTYGKATTSRSVARSDPVRDISEYVVRQLQCGRLHIKPWSTVAAVSREDATFAVLYVQALLCYRTDLVSRAKRTQQT